MPDWLKVAAVMIPIVGVIVLVQRARNARLARSCQVCGAPTRRESTVVQADGWNQDGKVRHTYYCTKCDHFWNEDASYMNID